MSECANNEHLVQCQTTCTHVEMLVWLINVVSSTLFTCLEEQLARAGYVLYHCMFKCHFMQRRWYTNVQFTVAPVSLPPPSFLQEMRTQINEKDWVAKLKSLLKKLHGTEYEKVSG